MRQQTNLVRRQGVYQFRIAVPADLRGHLNGTREVRKSLRTKDKAEAIKLAAAERARALAEFERVRKALNPEHRESLTPAEIEYLVASWSASILASDERSRALGLIDLDAVNESVSLGEDALREALPDGRIEVSGLTLEIGRVLRENGLSLPVGSPSWRLLGFAMMKGAERINTAIRARQGGQWVDTPAQPVSASRGPSLDDLTAYWKNLSPRREKTVRAVEDAIKRLTALAGITDAWGIERQHVLGLRDTLLGQGLSPKTVGKILALLSTVFQTAHDGGRLPSNPATRIKIPSSKGAPKSRLPFAHEELEKIVASLPTDDPPLFWMTLLAMTTGARLAELAQLRTEDVREQGDVRFLEITHEAGQLKTSGSARLVPLHVQLVARGFLTFVGDRIKQGEVRLFPGLKSDPFGKRWGRWLRKIGITDSRKVFHSFRHTFKTACREAGVLEEIHDALTGHSGGGVGRTYGDVPLKTLAEAIAKLKFPL